MDDDPMKVDEVIKLLNRALPFQMRSALHFTLIAARAVGINAQAVALELQRFGPAELEDVRRLAEKVVTLGGAPSTKVAPMSDLSLDVKGLKKLIELEQEATDALRKVIPASGTEARSEAREHLMEHCLQRKQSQIDFLIRVAQ